MVELRVYNNEMQQDIKDFYYKCFKNLGLGYEPGGRHFDTVNIQEEYMSSGCMWCLYDGDLLIGTVAVKNINMEAKNEKIAELKRLFVLKEYQNRGYGKLLLEDAISYAHENGFDKIRLDSKIEFSTAVHLYRKYGFTEIPAYNDNTKADLYMELKLN
ncbi:GNAT family N-acetyltransferase [Anaerosporobacter sp.]|uniref:GNAT family N-acetyltransferase n=1 Tax=Anaerosporobacter sp. TaxID=1872529 RepID=UPI00286F4A38|nr:GNAT family N-acetyltransferase [Anaerosporobacter sp.]